MTEGRRITLAELFARKEREAREYCASPGGQAAAKASLEKAVEEIRMQAVQDEGAEAAAAGLPATECPYSPDTVEGRLWVYGFENPPPDPDEDPGEDEPDDDEMDI